MTPLEPRQSSVDLILARQDAVQAILGVLNDIGGGNPWNNVITEAAEDAVDAAVESLQARGFTGLMWIAQVWLDAHYPADIPLICDRNSPDPGPRLAAALRDCIEAMK